MKKLYLSLFSLFFILTNNLFAEEVSTSEITEATQALTNTCTQTTILGIKQVTGIKDGVPFTKTNHCSKNGKKIIRFTCDSATNTPVKKINICELGCNEAKARCIKQSSTSLEDPSTLSSQNNSVSTDEITIQMDSNSNVLLEVPAGIVELAMDDFFLVVSGLEFENDLHLIDIKRDYYLFMINNIQNILSSKRQILNELKQRIEYDPTLDLEFIQHLIDTTLEKLVQTYNSYDEIIELSTSSNGKKLEAYKEIRTVLKDKLKLVKRLATIKVS